MALDINSMRSITHQLHVVAASKHFGPNGARALADLISKIIRLYRTVEPAIRKKPLCLFNCPNGRDALDPILGAATPVASAELVSHELDDACCVDVTHRTRLDVFDGAGIDPVELSKHAIVYIFKEGSEYFIIGGQEYLVENPSSQPSVFAVPTFSSLAEALQRFSKNKVLTTSCFLLEKCWADKKRIFFKPGPEEDMRKSLHQYLRDLFEDAEVRPEQVVDESHPVDIKVTWIDTNKRALIEIKWLGRSFDDTKGTFTSTHSDSRALAGAKQLADYLDADKTAAPGMRSRGYLVVIDARRRDVNVATKSVTEQQGMFYRSREIRYNPEYHKLRQDFEAPLRMFAEPILN